MVLFTNKASTINYHKNLLQTHASYDKYSSNCFDAVLQGFHLIPMVCLFCDDAKLNSF